MPISNARQSFKTPVISGYVIAVLSVAAALVISRWPVFHLQTAPVSLFLCAIMLSAWFGGVGPGLLAIVLSSLAFNYYFLEPQASLTLRSEDLPRFVVFALSALFAGALSAAQRRSTESLRRARDELRGTIQDLQKTNEALRTESAERKAAEEKLLKSQGYLSEAQRLFMPNKLA